MSLKDMRSNKALLYDDVRENKQLLFTIQKIMISQIFLSKKKRP